MSNNPIKKIAKNIRKYKKTSFKQLANDAGIPFSTLEKIIFEQIKDVQVSTLSKIALALGINIDELIKP
jgi:transcriptional regulator with XRE-family HTH domain